MDYNQPYGAGAGAAYVNGNPATGVPGSIPPAAAIEYPQREIVGIIADCGLTPDNANLHQLSLAVQGGQLNYADDTGTAGNLVMTLPRAPAAYVKGMRLSIKLLNIIGAGATINVNGLGAVAMNYRGGLAIQQGDFAAGDILEMVHDGTVMQVQTPTSSMIIDTALTLTIGVDFSTLALAMAWLSRRRISATGSVNIVLPSGITAVGSGVTTLQHPDGLRISITGAALTGGGFPTDANITITGYSSGARTTDIAAALVVLRARIPTELQFTGAGQIVVQGEFGLVSNLLLTASSTPTANLIDVSGRAGLSAVACAGAGGSGVYVRSGRVVGGNVMTVGCATGIVTQGGRWSLNGSLFAYSNIGAGVMVLGGSAVFADAGSWGCCSRGNGLQGIYVHSSSALFAEHNLSIFNTNGDAGAYCQSAILVAPGAKANSNGTNGFYALLGSTITLNDSSGTWAIEAKNNAVVGIYVNSGSHVGLSSTSPNTATISGNQNGLYSFIDSLIDAQGTGVNISATATTVTAVSGSFLIMTGATYGTTNPAVNTVGNSNSYIQA